MSNYSLNDLGGGTFHLRGRLELSNVAEVLAEGLQSFDSHENITIDIGHADCASTVGIALLLEWSTWSSAHGKRLSYANIPISLLGLARLNDVEQLLQPSF